MAQNDGLPDQAEFEASELEQAQIARYTASGSNEQFFEDDEEFAIGLRIRRLRAQSLTYKESVE